MIISKVQHTIDSLEHALSKGFIFILDTTDRSFIYKSFGRLDYSDNIVKIDHSYGIDQIMSNKLFHVHKEMDDRLLLKKIETHSFLGIFFTSKEYNSEILNRASNILGVNT